MTNFYRALAVCMIFTLTSFAAIAEQATIVHIEKKFDGQCKNLSEQQIMQIQQSLQGRGFYSHLN